MEIKSEKVLRIGDAAYFIEQKPWDAHFPTGSLQTTDLDISALIFSFDIRMTHL
jgi:hypothetical protein